MMPYLFQARLFGLDLSLPAYSLFALIGILAGGAVYLLKAWKGRELMAAQVLQIGLVVFCAFLGAKVVQTFIYLAENAGSGENFFSAFSYSGATVTGGLATAILVLLILISFDPFRIMNWRNLDAMAIAFPLGHAMGRIGCFFAGCCYGSLCPADFPMALTYPKGWLPDLYAAGTLVHGPRWPSPLFEAAGLLILFAILFVSAKRLKPGRALSGYLIGYGIIRFLVELSRGDGERGIWGIFSTGQFYAMASAAIGLALLSALSLRGRKVTIDAEAGFFGRKLRDRDMFSPDSEDKGETHEKE